MKHPAKPRTVAAKPFRVTGPGTYRTRDGRTAIVKKYDPEWLKLWPWSGACAGAFYTWNENGRQADGYDSPMDLLFRIADKPKRTRPAKRKQRVEYGVWLQCYDKQTAKDVKADLKNIGYCSHTSIRRLPVQRRRG